MIKVKNDQSKKCFGDKYVDYEPKKDRELVLRMLTDRDRVTGVNV